MKKRKEYEVLFQREEKTDRFAFLVLFPMRVVSPARSNKNPNE